MSVFKTPSFWYRQPESNPGITECALGPLSYVYDFGRALRQQFSSPLKASGPVVCVGNIVAGGSGKTPSVAAIHSLLMHSDPTQSVWILSRGYGGEIAGPVVVDPVIHSSVDVGDEPLLLATHGLKVAVSRDRVAGAQFAFEHGAHLVLMDDGFQNPTLHKDISILVIDGASGFGNGRLLPAGPLREKPESAFARAQAIILIGEDQTGILEHVPPALHVFKAKIVPQSQPDLSISYIGFAGLGRPEKFKTTLETLNLKITSFHGFSDHHSYSDHDIKGLRDNALKNKATLITTEKDFIRIPPPMRAGVEVLPIQLVFEEPDRVLEFLTRHIKQGLSA